MNCALRPKIQLLALTLCSTVLVSSLSGAAPLIDPYLDRVARQNERLQIERVNVELGFALPVPPPPGEAPVGTSAALHQATYLLCELEAQARGLTAPEGWVQLTDAQADAHLDNILYAILAIIAGFVDDEITEANPKPANNHYPGDSAMLAAYILQRFPDAAQGGSGWTTLTKNHALYLFKKGEWNLSYGLDPHKSTNTLSNNQLSYMLMALFAAEVFDDDEWWTQVRWQFQHAQAITTRRGVTGVLQPHYSGRVVRQLMIGRETNDMALRQLITGLLELHLVTNAHTYLPGGGMGAPQARDGAEGGISDPSPIKTGGHFIQKVNMVIYDPELEAKLPPLNSNTYDTAALATSYDVPEVIRSIFLHKGEEGEEGYLFRLLGASSWDSTAGCCLPENPNKAYPSTLQSWNPSDYRGTHGQSFTSNPDGTTNLMMQPVYATMLASGDAMIGGAYAYPGNQAQSWGAYVENPALELLTTVDFSILYHYQPKHNVAAKEMPWVPLVDDAKMVRERKSYVRMGHHRTQLALYDVDYVALQNLDSKDSGGGAIIADEDPNLDYTMAHLPEFMTQCNGNDWWVGQPAQRLTPPFEEFPWLAYRPLGAYSDVLIEDGPNGDFHSLTLTGPILEHAAIDITGITGVVSLAADIPFIPEVVQKVSFTNTGVPYWDDNEFFADSVTSAYPFSITDIEITTGNQVRLTFASALGTVTGSVLQIYDPVSNPWLANKLFRVTSDTSTTVLIDKGSGPGEISEFEASSYVTEETGVSHFFRLLELDQFDLYWDSELTQPASGVASSTGEAHFHILKQKPIDILAGVLGELKLPEPIPFMPEPGRVSFTNTNPALSYWEDSDFFIDPRSEGQASEVAEIEVGTWVVADQVKIFSASHGKTTGVLRMIGLLNQDNAWLESRKLRYSSFSDDELVIDVGDGPGEISAAEISNVTTNLNLSGVIWEDFDLQTFDILENRINPTPLTEVLTAGEVHFHIGGGSVSGYIAEIAEDSDYDDKDDYCSDLGDDRELTFVGVDADTAYVEFEAYNSATTLEVIRLEYAPEKRYIATVEQDDEEDTFKYERLNSPWVTWTETAPAPAIGVNLLGDGDNELTLSNDVTFLPQKRMVTFTGTGDSYYDDQDFYALPTANTNDELIEIDVDDLSSEVKLKFSSDHGEQAAGVLKMSGLGGPNAWLNGQDFRFTYSSATELVLDQGHGPGEVSAIDAINNVVDEVSISGADTDIYDMRTFSIFTDIDFLSPAAAEGPEVSGEADFQIGGQFTLTISRDLDDSGEIESPEIHTLEFGDPSAPTSGFGVYVAKNTLPAGPVNIGWDHGWDDFDGGMAEYILFRNGVEIAVVDTWDPQDRVSYSDSALCPAAAGAGITDTAEYEIRSVDLAGQSPMTTDINGDLVHIDTYVYKVDIEGDVTPPTVPGKPLFTLVALPDVITWWAPSTDNYKLLWYHIRRTNVFDPEDVTFALSNNPWLTDTPPPDETYTYAVRTADWCALWSEWSEESENVTIPAS